MKRYALMRHDMDVDARAACDGHAGRDAELGEALTRDAARRRGRAHEGRGLRLPPGTGVARVGERRDAAAADGGGDGGDGRRAARGAPLATAPLPPSAAAHRDLAYAALPAADGDGASTTERRGAAAADVALLVGGGTRSRVRALQREAWRRWRWRRWAAVCGAAAHRRLRQLGREARRGDAPRPPALAARRARAALGARLREDPQRLLLRPPHRRRRVARRVRLGVAAAPTAASRR